jgi:subtilase family serine protease
LLQKNNSRNIINDLINLYGYFMKQSNHAFLLSALALAIFSSQANALPIVNVPVHTPYRINENAPLGAQTGMTPNQVKTAYGISSLPHQGEGQVIAIVDAFDAPTIDSDLTTFNNNFGLAACTKANGCFNKIYASGTKPRANAGWSLETSLDVEWAHAIAPKAKIMLVEASSSSMNALFDAIDVAIKNGATVISMSWGGNEFSDQIQFDSVFNNPNVTFTASSGDNGHGLLYPAVSPYVISVGGTSLTIDGAGNYRGEKAWDGSGGGLSAYESEPAYQSQYGLPHNPSNVRGAPDVSYNADPASGFAVYDSTSVNGRSGWFVVGGTSAGAPQWAALIAITKSSSLRKLSNIHSLLYSIATNKYRLTYNDIQQGTNGTCGYECSAQVNYDYVTGLGSPQAQNLIPEIVNAAYASQTI